MKAKLESLVRHLRAEVGRLDGKPGCAAVRRLLARAQSILNLKGGAS